MTEERQSVLVVEDDVATRELFRVALRMAGFEVDTAADGASALRQIEQRIPDVVVLDLNLPGINGIALHGELESRERTRGLPIVIVTGTDWRSPYSAFATLSKPTEPAALVDAVRKAARRGVAGESQEAAKRVRTIVWLCPRCHHVIRETTEASDTPVSEMRVDISPCVSCAPLVVN